MAVSKKWKIKSTVVSDEQLNACANNRILASLLSNRGIVSVNQINEFLNPLKSPFVNPDVFTDMEKAVERIKSAVNSKEHITVFGDFDADGITSTALLYLTLKKIGADVDFYLPDRESESHGLNTKALVKLIAKQKSKLIITVDCGISNNTEVNFANGFKADIIITDHHEAPEILPNAFAILNPKAQGALSEDLSVDQLQSLNCLAGVGVAFKLACKLLETYNCENFVHEILPLAAVGTIGDVVELIGENRSIVSMGLELIRNEKHKGITKILRTMGISDFSSITSETIAYGIVPRLNAAGRLESPSTALNMLISDNEDELNEYISTLNDLNSLRQELCDETFRQAKQLYENSKQSNKKSIILFAENWHIGIIGIVSSKLVELYNKPVLLMTRDSNNTNIIRCSCRSISQINIYDVLSLHKDLFEGFGGHKLAAGFSFDENKIKFEVLKNRINTTIDELYPDVDLSQIVIDADMELSTEDVNIDLINTLEKLQPFGAGNPSPLFVINNLILKQYKMMGQNNNHLKLFVAGDNLSSLECVKWNTPDFSLPENSQLDILFSPKLNEYNGNTSIQLILEDIHSEFLQVKVESDIKILDHRKKKNIFNQVLDFVVSTKKKTAIFLTNANIKKQIEASQSVMDIVIDNNSDINEVEQLMFFESPVNASNFLKIINLSQAKIIHLMNFNNAEIIVDKYISNLSGMLKYALSNLNGKFKIDKLANALCVDDDTVVETLNLFEDMEIIDLNQISTDEYAISFINPVELSKIKQNESYKIIEDKISEINEFRKFYNDADIDQIKMILQ